MGETGNMLQIFQEERVKEALERLSQNYKVEGLVVANKEGTANFANIKGYEVGGKTGSALKSSDGIYTKKKI